MQELFPIMFDRPFSPVKSRSNMIMNVPTTTKVNVIQGLSGSCRALFFNGAQTLTLRRLSQSLKSGINRKKSVNRIVTGGRGGIRTHGSLATTPDFESGAFNHSATLPLAVISLHKIAIMRFLY